MIGHSVNYKMHLLKAKSLIHNVISGKMTSQMCIVRKNMFYGFAKLI